MPTLQPPALTNQFDACRARGCWRPLRPCWSARQRFDGLEDALLKWTKQGELAGATLTPEVEGTVDLVQSLFARMRSDDVLPGPLASVLNSLRIPSARRAAGRRAAHRSRAPRSSADRRVGDTRRAGARAPIRGND